jgi:cobalt/nickel transport system ATP-binding protein
MAVADLILEARDLWYAYGDDGAALAGLDLAVPRGARVALLGANGSGKTTLLLHLNGTLRPRRGRVLLDGQPADYSRHGLLAWRQRVGVVFQDPDDQLFAARVCQDVSFGPLNLGLSDEAATERVNEALAALDITALRDRPTHALSFGQRKRVALAGIVAMRPEVLVLDEPTAGLDPQGSEQLLAILDRLHRAGTTLVLATHDMDLAYGWADEVAVLSAGAVAGCGRPAEVLGDEPLLSAAGLRCPTLPALARRLREHGLLAADAVPRTLDELVKRLSEGVREAASAQG